MVNQGYLVYQDTPRYDWWLKLVLGGTLALTLVLGLWFFSIDRPAALVLLAVTVFDALLFHAILPRRLQVYSDRLTIVLGYPFAWNIYLSTIEEARPASSSLAFAYWGVRFATSVRSVVEIVRHSGWNTVISPSNRDLFLEHLNRALREGRDSNKQRGEIELDRL